MNENAERINGWAAMIGVIAAMGSYAVTGQIIPGSMVMGFVVAALLFLIPIGAAARKSS